MSTELNDVIAFIKGGIRPIHYDYEWLPQAVRMSFCQEHDLEYFNIGIYHGTDKLIFDMEKDVRVRYHNALKKYVDACIKCKDLKPMGEEGWYTSHIKEGNPLYEYNSMYFTPSLDRALAYADTRIKGIKFGELGKVARGFKTDVEKQGVVLDIDPETLEIIDELYDYFKDKKEPIPIIIKAKTNIIRSFSADESGKTFDDNTILKLKEKFVFSADWAKKYKNDLFTQWSSDSQNIAFRFNDDLTSDDYEIIYLDESFNKEIEKTRDDLERVYNDANEYIESFCRDKGNLLFDEKFLMELKEQFPIEEKKPYCRTESDNSYDEFLLETLGITNPETDNPDTKDE